MWGAWLLISNATQVLFLVFGAILFAISFHALARWISERTQIPYKIALGLCLLAVLGLGVGFGFWLGPRLVEQFGQLREAIPPALQEARSLAALDAHRAADHGGAA